MRKKPAAKTIGKPKAKTEPKSTSDGASSSGIEFAETQQFANGWKVLRVPKPDGNRYKLWVSPAGKRYDTKHAAQDDGFVDDPMRAAMSRLSNICAM